MGNSEAGRSKLQVWKFANYLWGLSGFSGVSIGASVSQAVSVSGLRLRSKRKKFRLYIFWCLSLCGETKLHRFRCSSPYHFSLSCSVNLRSSSVVVTDTTLMRGSVQPWPRKVLRKT